MEESDNQASCACDAAPKLVFACSGAADVGHITDLAARKINSQGAGKMFCLAGVGGRVSGIVETTKAAARVLAIDGCPLDCARNTLEQAGFTDFEHLQISEMGMEKGKTPVTEDRVEQVAVEGLGRLAG